MATCPKCQLPNPEGVEKCIWCGGHHFDSSCASQSAAASQGEAAVASIAELPSPVGISPSGQAALFHTPNTPVPEYLPLPSHVGLLLSPRPADGSSSGESRTRAETPTAIAAQRAVSTPPPSENTIPELQAKLVVLRGQKIGHEYPIYEGRNVIGRFADRPVDIDLNSQEAEGQIWSSRQHAAITFDRNLLIVEDLNSLNGTWVNAARLHAGQKRPLKAGDVIQIGTVQLKVVVC
jgi:hypothetical protein